MILALAAAVAAVSPCPNVATPEALVCRALEAQKNVEHDLLSFDPTMKGAKIDLAKTVNMTFQQKAAQTIK